MTKVDLNGAIKSLLAKVDEIEAGDDGRREKTQKIKAAATAFKTSIFHDGRKWPNTKAGRERRVKPATYKRYLRDARREFEKRNLKHHLLEREVARLIKRYPCHKAALEPLMGDDATVIRIYHESLKAQLTEAADLMNEVDQINFSRPGANRQCTSLAGKHPVYSDLINGLVGCDPLAAKRQLESALAELTKAPTKNGLLADLAALKVNHEVMYALALDEHEAKAIKMRDAKSLSGKKRRVVKVDHHNYLSRITAILTNPTHNTEAGTVYSMAPLAFALCAATGRRPIEILVTGDLQLVDSERLLFTGQAKKRFDEGRIKEREIYSLVDSQLVVDGLAALRTLPRYLELIASCDEVESFASLNELVSRRVPAFNQYAKDFFKDEDRTVKDARSIWAKIAHDKYFDTDPRWADVDSDVFYSELLGHEDEKAQLHYKAVKLSGFDPEYVPEPPVRADRLVALAELDDEMPDFARGDSAITLHNKVKVALKANPEAAVTQAWMKKVTGSKIDLIRRYMDRAAEALDIELADNGRWRRKDLAPLPVLVETDEVIDEEDELDDDMPEPALEVEQKEPAVSRKVSNKPSIKSILQPDGSWQGTVTINGQEVAAALGETSHAAKIKAWREYEYENSEVDSSQSKGGWLVTITTPSGEVFEDWVKGSRRAAEQAALATFRNR